jgi:hypothetical protein
MRLEARLRGLGTGRFQYSEITFKRVLGEPTRDFDRGREFKSQGGTSGRFCRRVPDQCFTLNLRFDNRLRGRFE